MKVKKIYDELVKDSTPEEILMGFLERNVIKYDKLKNDKTLIKDEDEIHPMMLISIAAMELGWELALPYCDDDDDVEGMVLGTEKYFDKVFENVSDESCCGGGCEGCGDELSDGRNGCEGCEDDKLNYE